MNIIRQKFNQNSSQYFSGKLFVLAFAISLFVLSPVSSHALTVGVANIRVHDSGLNADTVSEFFQAELQKSSAIKIRDRNSIKNVLKHLADCQSGLVSCQDTKDTNLKVLDVIIFGEFYKAPEGYTLHIRAVSERTWTVLYSNNLSGEKYESLMEDLAEELRDKFKVIVKKGENFDEDSTKYKYRIAIYSIKNANEQAQKVKVTGKLGSILISAFGKKNKFQIVESSRIQDLKNEKVLAMSGLVQTNRKAFEARGITHYLTGSLKVFDETRVLSYQIINIKTGLPIITDLVEWTDEKELRSAVQEVAKQSENQVFNINGRLEIKSCDLSNVMISLVNKRQSNIPVEIGVCPIIIEDIPKGNYTLIFKHEERDTLVKEITIKAQETTSFKNIKMPPINLSLYYQGTNQEAKGQYKEAIKKYHSFYKKYPRHRMATYALYREGFIIQIYFKKYDEGRKILENVIKKKPDSEIRTEAYYGIALGYRQSGNTSAGNNILKMLINEYPGSTAAEAAKNCLKSGNCSL